MFSIQFIYYSIAKKCQPWEGWLRGAVTGADALEDQLCLIDRTRETDDRKHHAQEKKACGGRTRRSESILVSREIGLDEGRKIPQEKVAGCTGSGFEAHGVHENPPDKLVLKIFAG
ncbi:MAG: hypothetical protein A3F26_03225 [Candidatus Ryanbacteria bacterium RIFCSPHIGHO2_12_FULL_47_12b]|nr:MAG: hypothetical protein A3F26_03225 [Candidatus Ryanbacteria bacterium RIFCSPHIGHO2_12_FULL_47_12b]